MPCSFDRLVTHSHVYFELIVNLKKKTLQSIMFKEIIFDKLAWRFLLIQLKLYIQNIVLLSLKNQSIL